MRPAGSGHLRSAPAAVPGRPASSSSAAGSTWPGSSAEQSITSAAAPSRARASAAAAVQVSTSGAHLGAGQHRPGRARAAPERVTSAMGGISLWPRFWRCCRCATVIWAPAVVLGARGARADDDDVGEFAQYREQPPVTAAAQAARGAVGGGAAVQAGDRVAAHDTSVQPGGVGVEPEESGRRPLLRRVARQAQARPVRGRPRPGPYARLHHVATGAWPITVQLRTAGPSGGPTSHRVAGAADRPVGPAADLRRRQLRQLPSRSRRADPGRRRAVLPGVLRRGGAPPCGPQEDCSANASSCPGSGSTSTADSVSARPTCWPRPTGSCRTRPSIPRRSRRSVS